jgi:PAS domain S-box-containing protein
VSGPARHPSPAPALAGERGATPLDHSRTPEGLSDDPVLAALLEGLTSATGEACFQRIASSLARALGVRYAVVAEFLPKEAAARTLAFWTGEGFASSVTYPLLGTPCQAVLGGHLSHHPKGLRGAFPEDAALVDLGAESYLGVPLRTAEGAILGHLFVMDTAPLPATARHEALMQIFAARATGELVRIRLERELAASEERFRDLFDEAPIAYVHEGLDTRFIRANHAAMRALEITPDEVAGAFGKSFVVDNPDNQRRLKEAFASVGCGTETSGVVLELRRRRSGKPLWIQWWSRPSPDGTYTRTMFIDITERVLLDQDRSRLESHNRLLTDEVRSAHHFGEMVGSSDALRAVVRAVARVAPTDSTVLIQGETGTGKELVARAVHEQSSRRAAPFVKVNCAALPAGLVESEFFGHEKGAFTGAVAARRGRFELADAGTIFLDEVGEVSPEVQVKLLRVLQESEFERVGGTQTIRVNVRVIAATNRDLAADVRAGRFRPDLFYRLNVYPIAVPPLRARADDIPLLASYFASRLGATTGRAVTAIEPETLERLARYPWPGNIRELRNVLERAAILSTDGVLRVDPSDLRTPAGAAGPAPPPGGMASLADAERAHILAALQKTGGVVGGARGAARLLGVPASTLRSTMDRLGIKG